jgi:hypothetical protein
MIRTRTFFSTLFLSIAAIVSPMAAAHDTLPKEWCTEPGMVPKIVRTISFKGPGLRDFLARCGIVDKDDWYAAHAGALYYCNAPDKDTPPPVQHSPLVVPYIRGPESFLVDDHHKLYSLDHGIEGYCVMCVPEK